MKKVKGYQCEFCKKLSVNSTYIKRHELVCFKNPASKSCITCKHLLVDFKDNTDDLFDYCGAKKTFLKKLQTNCSCYSNKYALQHTTT